MHTFILVTILTAGHLTGEHRVSAATVQDNVNYIAANLGVKYDVISNYDHGTAAYSGQITFTNNGGDNIEQGSWEIHFCHIRMMEPDHLPNPDGYEIPGSGLKVYHVNGCAFKLAPTTNFQTILPGGQLVVTFRAQHWTVSRTDIMPNWYVAAPGLNAHTITSTAGETLSFVGNFDTKEKWKRYWTDTLKDHYNPYTPEDRLQKADVKDLKTTGKKVIPTPREETITMSKTVYMSTKDWVIVHHADFAKEAQFLSDTLNIPITSNQPSTRYISLTKGQVTIGGALATSKEAYFVQSIADLQNITMIGVGNPGAMYAIQTLLSLIDQNMNIPEVLIEDAPRFAYRGMHVDVGRNFMPKESILRLIRVMAMYKMNKLHLHLTEDEGWRLEIKGLPELTSMGSIRCHDPQETSCVFPQLGSGAGRGNAGSGYYTVADYREILTLANQHHIEVIPEFDMPGHAHAAIHAMIVRNVSDYFLADPQDNSSYLSVQMFTDNSINPCLDSTYTFVDKVVKEVVAMHADIQPLKVFHFGGDEVAAMSWTGSPICQAKKPLHNSSMTSEWMEELKEEFVQKVSNLTHIKGLDLGGWEDGFIDGHHNPYDRSRLENANAIAYAWQNVWEWGQSNRAYKLANAGFQVVMSQATHLYFDHPYEPDPEERGYYWAPRFTDTRKTFGFMPDTLYRNADVKRNGEPITEEELCADGQCVNLTKPENIIGMQGQLWSETVRTDEQMDSMIYPRIIAVAERAWHKASWEDISDKDQREVALKADWEQFVNSLGYKELARLDKLGVNYYIPPPGAQASGSTITVRNIVPGLPMEYHHVGASDWSAVSETITATGSVEIVTRSADRRRVSRSIEIAPQRVPVSSAWTNHGGRIINVLLAIVLTAAMIKNIAF